MRAIIPLFLAFLVAPVFAQANYTKSTDTPPLRVSHEALQTVVNKAASLASAANSAATPRREEVLITSDKTRITLPKRNFASSNARIPERFDSFVYLNLYDEHAPIARVNFDFSDYRRTITVEGSSPDQVEAVFSAIRDDLVAISTPVGGTGIKTILGAPLYMLLISIIITYGVAWYRFRDREDFAIGIFAVALLITMLAAPIEGLLAGFLATRGEPSFMVRYALEIGMIGLISSVLGIAPIFKRFLTRSNTGPS